jgi:uncharacterized protein (TIGR00369 family)
MNFYEKGEEVCCDWEPRQHFQGYKNVLHGGIISTLMDEIASWYVFTKLRAAGVTSKINVKFIKPVKTDKGNLKLVAIKQEVSRRLADIKVKLYDNEGQLCSEGVIQYFIFPEEMARKRLYYPDFDHFFDKP